MPTSPTYPDWKLVLHAGDVDFGHVGRITVELLAALPGLIVEVGKDDRRTRLLLVPPPSAGPREVSRVRAVALAILDRINREQGGDESPWVVPPAGSVRLGASRMSCSR